MIIVTKPEKGNNNNPCWGCPCHEESSMDHPPMCMIKRLISDEWFECLPDYDKCPLDEGVSFG